MQNLVSYILYAIVHACGFRMTVEEFLYESFGDSTAVPELSTFDLEIQNFYYGQSATLELRVNLRNRSNHHISAAAPFELENILLLKINHQKEALMATTMLGLLESQFEASEEIQIDLFVDNELVLSERKRPIDSFEQCARAQLNGSRIVALASSSFYSARSLKGGVGEYTIRLAEPALLGVCLAAQRHVVFGSVLSGVVVLACDGRELTLSYGEQESKTIDGLDGEEVVLFVRLRAGKSATLL